MSSEISCPCRLALKEAKGSIAAIMACPIFKKWENDKNDPPCMGNLEHASGYIASKTKDQREAAQQFNRS